MQKQATPEQQLVRENSTVQQPVKRIRIMHVLDRLDVGGTERALAKLISGLDPASFEHYICALRGVSPAASSWAQSVTVLGGQSGRASFQFNVPRLFRRMREIRPDIVHSRNWGGIEAVVAAKLAGVPVTIHSEHGYELDMRSGLPFHRRLLRHGVYHGTTAVAAVTEDLREYHAREAWWPSEKFYVLHNGVDSQAFAPNAEDRRAVRDRYRISDNAFVIGSVGRIIALKNYVTLLRATENLISQSGNRDIRVLLVGSGSDLPALKRHVADSPILHDRVIFAGGASNVSEMLNAMDAFVLPSLMEGMSNTLLEAMAVGLPSLATRVGGNKEIILDGICGYLFIPQDVTDLARQLGTLADDPALRSAIGRAARDRVARDFSLPSMVERYARLYSCLLQQEASGNKTMSYVRN